MKTVLFAIVLSLALAGCDKSENSSQVKTFNSASSRLCTIPSGFEAREIYFGKEGGRAAVVVRKDGKEAMQFGSRTDSLYDEVRRAVFRKGGPGSAYIARNAGKEFVVNDGRVGAGFDSVTDLAITEDGRVVYAAKNGDKWLIVSGEQTGAPLDIAPELLVSPDGKHMAYIEQHVATKKQSLKLCDIGLKACGTAMEYDSVSFVCQDAAWTRLVYLVSKGGKKAIVTVDTGQPAPSVKEGAWYEEVKSVGISPKGNHVAYLAGRAGKMFLVKDGVEQETQPLSMTFDMLVADNGRTLHTGLHENRVVLAFLDGKRIGNEYGGIHEPSFSNDGSSFAFEATKNDKSVIVVNGSEGPTYDKIVTPRFSPDGSRLVYRARQTGARFIVSADNQGRTLKEHLRYDAVWDVTFSPDGKSVGYGVRSGNEVWWKVEQL